MQRSTWLRTAAIVTVAYAGAHLAGMPWTPVTGSAEQAVIDAMQGVRFSIFGVSRSYWDFYQGFGVAISAMLLVQAALLWQCGAIAKAGSADIRPLIVTQLAGFLVLAAITARYIFAPPLIMAAVIAACLACALLWPQRPRSASG
jgi:hypothetical protein